MQKIINKFKYLAVMAITMLMFSSVAAAEEIIPVGTITEVGDWAYIDVGPAEQSSYAFNTKTIKFAKNEDGSLNKNIIIYDEKKTNMVAMSSEFKYYSITKCQLNVENHAILFGDESFYTKKDKFRWTDTPTYLTWITVSDSSIGGIRYSAIVDYVQHNEAQVEAQS